MAVLEMPFGFTDLEKVFQIIEFLDNRKELLDEFKPEVQKYLVKREFFKGAFRHKYNQMFEELVLRLIKSQLVKHFPSLTPEEILLLTDRQFLGMITDDFYFNPIITRTQNMDRRIRYNKTGNGLLTSLRNFTTDSGSEVKVELDVNNKKFRILDAITGLEVKVGGDTRNVAVLKIQAKEALKAVGVAFAPESRNRTN